tara:strand:+ start:646 stop:1812 length:1167 start_codon:yes stop_codon:yes gene_type:complete
MKIFDKFFTKFAYKFDKGYPDMNNDQDVLLLESLISEVMGKEIILEVISKAKSIKAAEDFVKNSQFAKDNEVRKFTSGKYANRINSSKEKSLDKIEDALISHFGISKADIEKIDAGEGPASKDSMSGFKLNTGEDAFGEIYISVSTGKKGDGGKLNERNFNVNINEYASIDNPIDVKLISGNKTYLIKDVTQAVDASTKTTDGQKADTILLDKKGIAANISLKQPEGFRWASLNNDKNDFRKSFVKASLDDPNFPIELKLNPNFENKNKYEMFKRGTDNRITLAVITDAPFTKDEKNIFGTDNPKTIVVGRKFKPSDFKFNEDTNTLDIEVDHIFETMEEISDSPFEPVFVVAQHSGQSYGLDFRSYPKFMAKLPKKGTGIEINYSDL